MIKPYNRINAVNYAKKWALDRNPKYYNFDNLGGDCTNFVSQSIYAGSGVMNFNQNGWFYSSLSSRAPAWTGVSFLHDFLLSNKGVGPFGIRVELNQVDVGDVIFLEKPNSDLFHTLIISKIINNEIFVCSHTRNALDMPLNYFSYSKTHCIHIEGVRT